MCTEQKEEAVKLLLLFIKSGSEGCIEEGEYQSLREWILQNDHCPPGAYFPQPIGGSLLKLCAWRVRSAWSLMSEHQTLALKVICGAV